VTRTKLMDSDGGRSSWRASQREDVVTCCVCLCYFNIADVPWHKLMIDRPNSGSDALKSVPDRLGDLVTIAMVPRDTFAWSNKVLDRLIDTTSDGVRIIVFDTGASGCPREYMEKRCKEADVTLLRSRGIATSSQARNKAIELVGTK